jgi:hypothetical protein
MKACRSVCGVTALLIPTRRAAFADDPPGAVPVQPLPGSGQEDGAAGAFAGGQVDRPRGPRRERDHRPLAALPHDGQGPVAAFGAESLDVGAGGLGDPQPLSASSETSACSTALPIPAATSRAPTSLRSSPVACDS